ncbi:adenosylcobinamide-phosphate synthase CbiB [Paracoccus sp. XHP0099]|uniref:Cobalamin biosynthesis protein CobD n=2 Tax=Paracoccus marinaquae TaxID=2841926 RepID=A0ABS6AJE7_9RHOB|nr:adenosylcobinamide-phosphate synthase CbiB [Paracoccus marinaquae]MBU3030713.1 adenosylcobinamide-phosphate synthase CbiB [Paracoccus marinaquae]
MPLTALIALILDAAIGWPEPVFRRIGHPVTWLGRLIATLDRRLNRGGGRVARGAVASLLVIGAALLPAIWLQGLLGPVLAGILAWPLVAARSLHDHLRAVETPLSAGDLDAARQATSMIVGRDVSRADQAALARASIESLAENASDGVIAPLFWAAVAGLPGIAAYKAINTLDSMIGHRTPRHAQFGRFAARLDDAANWLPARLTALLIALAGGREAWRVARCDARAHRSPNAGWPEAAMAGALAVRLSGPRAYADRIADESWLNAGARDPQAADIGRALAIYRRATISGAAILLVLALL